MGCSASVPKQSNNSNAHNDRQGLLDNRSDHMRTQLMKKRHDNVEDTPTVNTSNGSSSNTHNNKKDIPESSKAPSKKSGLPSTAKPINRARDRVDAIPESVSLDCGGIKLRYAYLSQRGFYPDDPFKANQDAYCVQKNLLEGKSDAFFGVFDGHGSDGDGCAIFAKNTLPTQVKAHLEKSTRGKKGATELTKEQIQTNLVKAHVETNKLLRRNSKIDDSLSGTTAISVYFHGRRNRITISNVGDSRAVLGQEIATAAGKPRAIRAQPLSRDQTPYRKDERDRVKAAGARVLSMDQLEGLEPILEGHSDHDELELGEELDEDGDPPRVWSPNGDYPGTAFTRSIGDAIAEELGVFAEPEMLTREVIPEDKIIVLASDGVFEFLTNQAVIDICAKFKDPLEACRAVVSEAHELWLQYELRTDDITVICIFIDSAAGASERRGSLTSSISGSVRDLGTSPQAAAPVPSLLPEPDDTVDNSILTSEGLRPVRKNVSKEKSKAIEKLKGTMHGVDQTLHEEDFDWRKLATEKTPEEKAAIAEAIKASVMFRNINDEQREMIFSCMESVSVKAGTWVIRQGSVGDRFYIVDDGRFEVRIVPDDEEDMTGEGGHIVHVYEGSRERNAHPAFGELALMYSAPRSASIIAQTDGHLWALHRSAFRQVLIQAQDHRKDLKKALGEIPYFQYLDSDGINKLAAIMDEITFGRGENIAEQGRPGDKMYVIRSGTCYSVQIVPGETKRANLRAGNYFGDEIFADNGIYGKTVVSLQTLTCWQLDATVLKQTMGPLLQGGA